MPHKPRSEMTKEEREFARRQAKRGIYLREIGKPLRITPDEFADIKARVADCYDRGMSFYDMADQTGVGRHAFGDMLNGRRKSLNRDTYERMQKLHFKAPEGIRAGSCVNPVGVVRRLEALRALAFPLTFIAEQLGVQVQNIRYVGDHPHGIYLHTQARVEELYEKYRDRKPEEFGYGDRILNRVRTISQKHGFAPPSCWDEDTIDDPDAFPEWTGECGTEEGYRIHIRETFLNGNPLPPCTPCMKAVQSQIHTDEVVFSVEKFLAAQEESGLTSKEVADKSGVHSDTIYRWRSGVRVPRKREKVETLAAALDCNAEDLLDNEATDSVAVRTVGEIGGGRFNPHILRVLLELSGMSYGDAARLPGSGVSSTAVSKWARGESAPKTPDKVKFLADRFGTTVERFYS